VAGDSPPLWFRPVLPQVNPLPNPKEQFPAIKTQRQGLGGEGRTDVGRHVVVTLVIVSIAGALAVAVEGTTTILRDHRIHPGLQIRQNPGIGVLIDGQAAAGVQAAQVQHASLHASGTNPVVEFPVQAAEAWAVGRNLDCVQVLLHGPALAGLTSVAWS
jgi:hypothetical protein